MSSSFLRTLKLSLVSTLLLDNKHRKNCTLGGILRFHTWGTWTGINTSKINDFIEGLRGVNSIWCKQLDQGVHISSEHNGRSQLHYLTTGNPSFAESFWVCQGLDLGHSAKALFAEGQPQEPSAKIGPRQRNGPRQNKSLPREPSANWPSANMAVWVTVATGVSLCQVLAVRHSAKIFYFF